MKNQVNNNLRKGNKNIIAGNHTDECKLNNYI